MVLGAVVPEGGRVTGKDVAAWVELRAADGSWKTLPTEEFMSDTPPADQVPAGEGVVPLAAHAADYFARPSLVMVPFEEGSPPVRWVLCWRRGHATARVAALAGAARSVAQGASAVTSGSGAGRVTVPSAVSVA